MQRSLHEKDFLMQEMNHWIKTILCRLRLISALVEQPDGAIDLVRKPHPVFTKTFSCRRQLTDAMY